MVFVSDTSAVNLMASISIFNELRDFLFVYIPDREYIINIPFLDEWFCGTLEVMQAVQVVTSPNYDWLH